MNEAIASDIIDDRPFQRRLDQYFLDFNGSPLYNEEEQSEISYKNQNILWQLPLKICFDDVIVLQEPHCPSCGARLIKNGLNRKVEFMPNSNLTNEFWLQRYVCRHCGEIRIDYSKIFPQIGRYDEKLSQQARLIFFLGIPPCKMQEILIVMAERIIPLSTIKFWIYPLKSNLTSVLYAPKMPCYGSLVYDEIHLKIGGDKAYLYAAICSFTRLVIRSELHSSLERSDVKLFFRHIQKDQNILVDSVVHDGCGSTASAFTDRSLQKIKQGRCHTHFKWNIREKVYDAAGLGKQIKKPLPPRYFKFLRTIYWTIGAKSEFKFWIRLEIARAQADSLQNEKLHKIINLVEGA